VNFQKVEFELAAGRKDQLPKGTVPEIVFSGKSNVGKSSLINKLVNRKALARVSATPGKTATINFFRLPECRLVDLPGYGYAKVSKGERDRWASLVEGYFAQERPVALVIQLVDMRHKPTADDLQMVEFLQQTGRPFIVVCTKCDKLNRSETQQQTALFDELFQEKGIPWLPFSSVKGTGLTELQGQLSLAVEGMTE
jgi:GTP-binding protein